MSAELRQHYLVEMVNRVAKVEALIKIIAEDEQAILSKLAPGSANWDPDYWVQVQLKDNFTHKKNKAMRDRYREEAKMFALAAEALRPPSGVVQRDLYAPYSRDAEGNLRDRNGTIVKEATE